MTLQISLLILGALSIVAIYYFSRWQEKKRRTNQSTRGTQSSRRNNRDNGAAAPAFERTEPGFDQNTVGDDADARYASLDTIEPPVVNDYVDADNFGSPGQNSINLADNTSEAFESQVTGKSTLLDNDFEEDDQPSRKSEYEAEEVADTDVEDYPTLENIVSTTDSVTTFEADTSVATEADLGDRFVDELDVPSDTVEISQGDYSPEEQAAQSVQVSGVEEPELVESQEAAQEVDVVVSDTLAEAPVLGESEVMTPESFSQSSLIEQNRFDAEEPVLEQSGERGSEDVEAEYAEARPSLKAFLGSLGPISKLKANIQNQLDSVKAERERSHSGADPLPATKENVEVETDFAVHTDVAAEGNRTDVGVERGIASGHEFIIDEADESGSDTSAESSRETQHPTSTLTDTIDTTRNDNDDSESVEVVAPVSDQSNAAGDDRHMITPAEGFDKLSQIDYYVKLSGERDVSRDSVLAIYREGAAGIARTHSIYGLRLPEKVWRDLEQESEDARFGDLVVTIQLVDQDGLVTENDMTRFSSLIMKLSESTGRGFSFMAPIENAHKQAEAIGRFKQQFDSIFVVNIRPLESEMFEGAVIERCAKQIGLTADNNQFFARYKPVGKQKVCLYSLANMSDTGEFDLENMRAVRTRGVTFFTRPAINRSPGAVFAEMVDAAKAFASRIKGEVIAPGYDDLSSDDVEAIRRSIEKVAAEMESYGINPGSEEATRLFG